MKEFKTNLIGLGLMILCIGLSAIPGLANIFMFPAIIGAFMFASFPDSAAIPSYVMIDSGEVLLRKRYYFIFFPFQIVIHLITLGKGNLKIPYKQEYFIASANNADSQAGYNFTKIPRKEYVRLRNQQRQLYSTRTLSKDFWDSNYSDLSGKYKKQRRKLVISWVLTLLVLMTLPTAAEMFFLMLAYEVIFVFMVALWTPDYKDAKILYKAYQRTT